MLYRAALTALSSLALLLLFWCGPGGESRPFLAPLLLSGGLSNGTSALELLALAHLQHKLNTINALAGLMGNFTGAGDLAGRRRLRRRRRRRRRRNRRRRRRRPRALFV